MTFDDIVAEVQDRLNLSSAVAIARIGRSINERYKSVCSAIGMATTVQGPATATTTIGNPQVIFAGCEKVLEVFNPAFLPPQVLTEISLDEMENLPLGSDPPFFYAIVQMGANTVTIQINSAPATTYTLGANAILQSGTLSGTMVPVFAEDFHDLLYYWAMYIEYTKMEKETLAAESKTQSEQRLSDLRFFIAKSAYLDLYQGKTSQDVPVPIPLMQ